MSAAQYSDWLTGAYVSHTHTVTQLDSVEFVWVLLSGRQCCLFCWSVSVLWLWELSGHWRLFSVFFYTFLLAMCAGLSWSHSAFVSTLNFYHIVLYCIASSSCCSLFPATCRTINWRLSSLRYVLLAPPTQHGDLCVWTNVDDIVM